MCIICYSSSQTLELLKRCVNSYTLHASFIGFVNDILYVTCCMHHLYFVNDILYVCTPGFQMRKYNE